MPYHYLNQFILLFFLFTTNLVFADLSHPFEKLRPLIKTLNKNYDLSIDMEDYLEPSQFTGSTDNDVFITKNNRGKWMVKIPRSLNAKKYNLWEYGSLNLIYNQGFWDKNIRADAASLFIK